MSDAPKSSKNIIVVLAVIAAAAILGVVLANVLNPRKPLDAEGSGPTDGQPGQSPRVSRSTNTSLAPGDGGGDPSASGTATGSTKTNGGSVTKSPRTTTQTPTNSATDTNAKNPNGSTSTDKPKVANVRDFKLSETQLKRVEAFEGYFHKDVKERLTELIEEKKRQEELYDEAVRIDAPKVKQDSEFWLKEQYPQLWKESVDLLVLQWNTDMKDTLTEEQFKQFQRKTADDVEALYEQLMAE